MIREISNSKVAQVSLALLRILIGWHFLYEGLIKLFDPNWSARPFLEGSRWIFGDLFRWMSSGDTGLQIVDFLNAWGLTFVGLALILGIFTRLASWGGITMLLMYYLAYPPFGGYNYGAVNEGSYLVVNKNLIELVCLLVVAFTRSGQYFGIEQLLKKKKTENEPVQEAKEEPQLHEINRRRELIKGLAGLPVPGRFCRAIS